jgi:hypothetical protein
VPLATAALWVRIQTSLKNKNGRHKQRSGQHTLARKKKTLQKNILSTYFILEDMLVVEDSVTVRLRPRSVLFVQSSGGSGSKTYCTYGGDRLKTDEEKNVLNPHPLTLRNVYRLS